MQDGKVYYSADSDAIITKGITALLMRVMNGRTPQQILDTDLYFIDAIGLKENLSPTRSNGLLAMIKQMRMYALAFNAELQAMTNRRRATQRVRHPHRRPRTPKSNNRGGRPQPPSTCPTQFRTDSHGIGRNDMICGNGKPYKR